MARIAVIGVGYVGLVTASCFADLGHEVAGIDIDEERIAKLRQKVAPIYEPGLESLIGRNLDAGRLRFTTDYVEGLSGAQFAFIAVGTPSGLAGEADMSACEAAARGIAQAIRGPIIVVNKSTMPIGSGDRLEGLIREALPRPLDVRVVSNPEFLREGTAVSDFFAPDRIVLGSLDTKAAEAVADLHRPLNAPVLLTDMRTAEMVKYASNAFIATRISFINEIAAICEQLGADVKQVADGMGLDPRIGGRNYLNAGLGYGGSCFPKDVRALEYMASVHGCHPQLLRAVMEINRDVRRSAVQKLRDALGSLNGRLVGVLGLAFKPNTDDVREAAAIELIHLLQHEGAMIRAYDPVAIKTATPHLPNVEFVQTPYEVAAGADALVLVTEWNEFRELDMARIHLGMRTPVLLDGRNIYDPHRMVELGFTYLGMGRVVPEPLTTATAS
ncbi:MAG: UDP-glucose/GDP-mannose dehydrogenase family protein [Chloroflexi bacterium]|nr:UDP-glucose/GDP-mannose dehydrogenase family protein [Chloroflexota bacterium]